ncbi:MAG: flagellar motor switch protein FliG [Pseudomonadota bacterium]|uniref:Flagellar motor switch protein FliG n=1 Tax=Candidatus Desulfatibia profunda TaxID=2841695 RepID=A0A8J6NVI5_9BACT|nr:flagellar motor switch protein FliG [Candidatus Desulfatibia profunda]MBL7195971.1 flagellar motor switch protein FliG [Desulfobacterales bacterium]
MATTKLNLDKLTGPQKAAVIFLTMGEEFTARFFKALDEKSIKRLGKYMSEINYIPSEIAQKVMDEFLVNIGNDVNLVVSGQDFLKQVVNKTLDKDSAREVFKDIGDKSTTVPFSDLAFIASENLVSIIQGEHPQTIALVLSYLPHEKAAEILKSFSDELMADIALRLVQIGHVDLEVVSQLDEIIRKDLTKIGTATRKFDGIETLANILNEVDGKTEETVLGHIENEDSDLAAMIRQKMFVFEDLLQIENRYFRDILQNVDNQILSKALRTASEDMKKKIYNNLSERAAEMLKDDIEVMGPVKLSEVEAAQQEVIKTAKRLETEGRIVLSKGKEDVFV